MKLPKIYIEPRDIWVGAYIGKDALYVCPLPMLVLKWERKEEKVLGVALRSVKAGDTAEIFLGSKPPTTYRNFHLKTRKRWI